jgi:nucleoside-diphosphate-sugar epimerase
LILITGATGFLGRNLCERLTHQGHRLRALVRPASPARGASDTLFLEALGVEIATGDVRDLESVKAAMVGCDTVIHAAARFRLWGPPEPFEETNLWGTRNVLASAYQYGIRRFIHISTIIVVGPQPPGTVITEETPYGPYPGDYYARTKMGGERLALSYAEIGLPVIVLRPGALYGPWGHYAFNRLFFEEYLRGWRVQVHQGRHIIFPCYVGDAARAIEASLTRGRLGEIYNISGQSISHREANETVSRLAPLSGQAPLAGQAGKSSWRINMPAGLMINFARLLEFLALFTRREPFYPLNLVPYVFEDWVVSSEKASRELGFQAISFEQGAQFTLEWYRSIGYV